MYGSIVPGVIFFPFVMKKSKLFLFRSSLCDLYTNGFYIVIRNFLHFLSSWCLRSVHTSNKKNTGCILEMSIFHTNFATLLVILVQEHLAEERKELESQREKYQQDLERLRESTRAVEKEKERLEHQKKIKRKTIEVGNLWWWCP